MFIPSWFTVAALANMTLKGKLLPYFEAVIYGILRNMVKFRAETAIFIDKIRSQPIIC